MKRTASSSSSRAALRSRPPFAYPSDNDGANCEARVVHGSSPDGDTTTYECLNDLRYIVDFAKALRDRDHYTHVYVSGFSSNIRRKTIKRKKGG